MMDAAEYTPEELAQANRENSEHASYRRALYCAVVPKFSEHFLARPIFRPTVLERATVDAGRDFKESAKAEADAAKRERKLHVRTAAAAAQIGLRVPPGRTSESRATAAEELASLMAEAGENSEVAPAIQSVCETAPKKTYTLHSSAPHDAAHLAQQKAIYWGAWKRLAAVRPDLDRHALTRRCLGCNKPVAQFTAEDFRKMISAFSQVSKNTTP